MYKLIVTMTLSVLLSNSLAQAHPATTQDECLQSLQKNAKAYDPQPFIAFAKKLSTALDRILPKEGIFLTTESRAKYELVVKELADKEDATRAAALVQATAASMIVNPTVKSKSTIAPLRLYVVPDPLITSAPLATIYGRYPTDLELWDASTGVPECDDELDNCDILQDRENFYAFFLPTRHGKIITPRITLRSTVNDIVLAHEFGHFCQFIALANISDPLTAQRILDAENIVVRQTDNDIDVESWAPINKLLELELYQMQLRLPENPSHQRLGLAMLTAVNIFLDNKKLREKLASITDENTAKKTMKDVYKKGPSLKARERIEAILDKIPFVALADELDNLRAEYEALESSAGFAEFLTMNCAPYRQLSTLAASHGINSQTGLVDENAIHQQLTLDFLREVLRDISKK